MFLKKGVLKICSRFTEEHPCRSGISIQLQSNFIKIALWHGCSLVNLLHIFRTSSPRNASGWLLLNIRIIYLHVTEACLKFTFAMFNFCHSENPSSFMKNVFNSISIYSWKKSLWKEYKEQMCYKKGKSLFFDVMKNDQIFPSKVCHLFENRFLFNREMGNIRSWKEVRLQKFIKSRLSK